MLVFRLSTGKVLGVTRNVFSIFSIVVERFRALDRAPPLRFRQVSLTMQQMRDGFGLGSGLVGVTLACEIVKRSCQLASEISHDMFQVSNLVLINLQVLTGPPSQYSIKSHWEGTQ